MASHVDVTLGSGDAPKLRRLSSCWRPASSGNLAALQDAHENGAPWDERVCANAARDGHLDVLIYAHENGCRWDARTCEYSAQNGHLQCLKYARSNGCPWERASAPPPRRRGSWSA
jgi:hypothetical protein